MAKDNPLTTDIIRKCVKKLRESADKPTPCPVCGSDCFDIDVKNVEAYRAWLMQKIEEFGGISNLLH